MSSSPNHRRGHGRVQERGPRWENPDPSAGCNSTHVARARRGWQNNRRRALRRKAKREATRQAAEAEREPMTDKPDEYLHIKPMPDETLCEVHDWPTQDLPRRLVAAMRKSHPKGISACKACVHRAQEEGEREREAKCVLCQRGLGRGAGNRGHGFQTDLGMLDASCPVSLQELTKLEAELKDAVKEMFGPTESGEPSDV